MEDKNVLFKERFLNTQLYLVYIGKMTVPLLVNGLVLLYTDKTAAENAVQRFRKLYNNQSVKESVIQDNVSFFASMVACNMDRFLLDGEGQIYRFSSFCDKESVDKYNATHPSYNQYRECINSQPKRVITSPPSARESMMKVKRKTFKFIGKNIGLVFLIMMFILWIIISANTSGGKGSNKKAVPYPEIEKTSSYEENISEIEKKMIEEILNENNY